MNAKDYLKQFTTDNPDGMISYESIIELMEGYAKVYHEAKVKNISSKPMLADRLPNAEDIKRWYQLLVGKSEDAMQKDIEATLR